MDQDSPPVIAQSFDQEDSGTRSLTFVPPTPRCPKHDAGEIVVCAQNPETFRLRPPAQPFADDEIPRARLKLGEGAAIGAELEREGVGGHVSNRIMLRGRVKF